MTTDASDNFKLLIGFPVLFINLLALYILAKSSKLDFKIRTLAINLCLADCWTCISLCPPRDFYRKLFGSNLKDFFVLLPASVSFLTITLFNLDRFLALKATMIYYRKVSRHSLQSLCLVTWLLSLALTSAQYCSVTGGSVCLMVPSSVKRNTVIVGYIRLAIFLTNVFFFGTCLYHVKYGFAGVSDRYKCMSQTRAFLKISAITGTFLILFTPGMIWTILKPYATDRTMVVITDIVCGLSFSASFIMDPIWYILRFSDCRFQLKLLRYVFQKHKREEIKAQRKTYYATFQIACSSQEVSDSVKM